MFGNKITRTKAHYATLLRDSAPCSIRLIINNLPRRSQSEQGHKQIRPSSSECYLNGITSFFSLCALW